MSDVIAYPPEFREWPKITRLRREIIVTEKIDGTNACVLVPEDPSLPLVAGKRSSWIYPGPTDNHGFAAWVKENEDELRKLGPGTHFGEWWGKGINKRYPSVTTKRFSLFNTIRWNCGLVVDDATYPPACCDVVPVLYFGPDSMDFAVSTALTRLQAGSVAAPGCKAEGVVVYHTASRHCYKVTLEKDDEYKGKSKE